MPFASDKQRRYLWSQKPEVAKKFAEHKSHGGVTGGNPMHVKKVTQKDRYGNTMSYEFEVPEKGIDTTKLMEKQMDMMMEVPQMMGVPEYDHPGEPRGSDTVPAWLTPGEFVVNAEAMRLPGAAETVEAINNQGRAIQNAQGGSIPTYHDGGIIPAPGVSNPETDLGFPFPQRKANGGEITNVQKAARGWAPVEGGLEGLLHEREGYVPEIYLDSLGKPTVGYGHLIENEVWDKGDERIGTQPYSEAELKAFFDKDVQAAQNGAIRNIGEEAWAKLNPAQQDAVTSMAFQLGEAGQAKFGNMIKAMQAGDYERVAIEALTGSKPGTQSKWLKQTPKRAFDLAEAFHPGVSAAYKADGGVVYADDGGWKGFLNKHILGPKTQLPVGDVPDMEGAGANWSDESWTPPVPAEVNALSPAEEMALADTEYQGEGHPMEEYLRTAAENEVPATPMGDVPEMGDPYDESSGIPPVEVLEEAAAEAEGVLGQGSGEYLDSAEGRKDWATESSAEYQAYVGRARSAGIIPKSPAEWREMNTVTEGTDSTPAQRNAPFSETVGQDAATKVLNEGGSAGQADAASAAADEVIANGGTKEEAAKAAEDAANSAANPVTREDDNEQPETDPETNEGNDMVTQAQEQATEQQNKAARKEAQSVFQKLGLDSLFDPKELARMAVMYAGSRLLGYGHGGSLQWAAKGYLNRIDAKEQGMAKLALSGKYTPESLKKFKKSGDYSDLESPATPPVITGNTMQRSIGGRKAVFQEIKVGDNVLYQGPDGRKYTAAQLEQSSNPYEPAFEKGTPEYRARRSRATSDAAGRFEEVRNSADAILGERGSVVGHKTNIHPKQAADEFWGFMEAKGIDPESDEALQIMTNAYSSAIADAEGRDFKPSSLKPFLEQEFIRQKTGAPEVFITNPEEIAKGGQPKYVHTDKMQTLLGNFETIGAQYGKSRDEVMQKLLSQWQQMPPEKQATFRGQAGESPFYIFAQQEMDNIFAS